MSEEDTSSPHRVAHRDAQLLGPRHGVRRPTGLGERLDVDAERRRAFGDGEPDGAEADDAHGRPEQTVGLAVALLVPVTAAEVRHVVGDPPVDRQQKAHGELGHGGSVAAGHVGDEDPAAGGGIGVDRVRAGPGPDHQHQPVGGLEHRALDLGAAHHQSVEPGDPCREIVGREPGLHHADVSASFELDDRLLGEPVGEE